MYSDDSVARIRLVKNAVGFGFAVKELAGFLRACDAGHPPCHQVRSAGRELLAAMERRLTEMTAARDDMRRLLERWDRAMDRTAPGMPARLLASITPSLNASNHLRRGR